MLKALAVRYQHLTVETDEATAQLQVILGSYAPMLQDLPGVRTDVVSQLLVTLEHNQIVSTFTVVQPRPGLVHRCRRPQPRRERPHHLLPR